MSTSEESERRLAEALRAQASGAGRTGFVGRNPGSLDAPAGLPGQRGAAAHPAAADRRPAPAGPANRVRAALVDSRYALLLALLGGVVLGVALALFSLLAPGVLPPL